MGRGGRSVILLPTVPARPASIRPVIAAAVDLHDRGLPAFIRGPGGALVVANLWVSPWADALVLSHALNGLLPGSCFRRNTSAPACAHDQLADALASSASATAHLDTVREGYRVTRENQHVIIRQAFMGASRW